MITSEAACGHLTREGIAESSDGELKMKRPKGLYVLGKTPCAGNRRWRHAFTTEGYLLIARPAEIKKSSRRGADKAPKSRREDIGSKSEKEPDLQELCFDPKEHTETRKTGKCI